MNDKLEMQVEKIEPDYFAQKIDTEFNDAKAAKLDQEKIFLRAHYNMKGVYDPSYDIAGTTSKAFVQVTAPRIQTAVSMIIPVLMPPGDKPYTIDATPRETIPSIAAQLVAEGADEIAIEDAIRKEAESRADRLAMYVDDGFVETQYASKLQMSVLDASVYGTGILAGPFAAEKRENLGMEEALKALENPDAEDDKYKPEVEYVSPWDVYPDPTARCVEDCGYVIHRNIMSVAKVRELRHKPGFDVEAIDEVLDATPNGNFTPEWWETTLDTVNSRQQTNGPANKFVCLIRWGWISGRDLRDCGKEVPDELLNEQVMAAIWKIGHKVISVRVSKLHKNRIPFYFVPYRKVPNSIWGMGVAEMMFDSQDAINACERAKMDNMALSSRPMAVVYPSRLHPGHRDIEMRAGKIWVVEEAEIQSQYKPVDFFVPDCRLDQIEAVQRDHFQFVQEQTGIPNALMGMGGQGTHNRTAEGATLQFNAAATALKTVIYNFETYLIIPITTAMAKFYQMFSDDPKIMGDYRIYARGLQGLMARENLVGDLLHLVQIVGTVPQWAERTNLDRIFDIFMRAKGMTDQNIAVPSEVVAEQKMLAAQAQGEQELAMAEAQNQMQQKQRAETAPRDAMLEVLKQAEPGPFKTEMLGKVLDAYDLMDEQIAQTLEAQKALEANKMLAESEELNMRAQNQGASMNREQTGEMY
jgi:hypothetical protein